MNKKRNFAKMALLSALLCGLASPTFVGCKDYDDDIKDLQEQIDANKSAATQELSKAISEQITALENKLNTAIADKADKGVIEGLQTDINNLKNLQSRVEKLESEAENYLKAGALDNYLQKGDIEGFLNEDALAKYLSDHNYLTSADLEGIPTETIIKGWITSELTEIQDLIDGINESLEGIDLPVLTEDVTTLKEQMEEMLKEDGTFAQLNAKIEAFENTISGILSPDGNTNISFIRSKALAADVVWGYGDIKESLSKGAVLSLGDAEFPVIINPTSVKTDKFQFALVTADGKEFPCTIGVLPTWEIKGDDAFASRAAEPEKVINKDIFTVSALCSSDTKVGDYKLALKATPKVEDGKSVYSMYNFTVKVKNSDELTGISVDKKIKMYLGIEEDINELATFAFKENGSLAFEDASSLLYKGQGYIMIDETDEFTKSCLANGNIDQQALYEGKILVNETVENVPMEIDSKSLKFVYYAMDWNGTKMVPAKFEAEFHTQMYSKDVTFADQKITIVQENGNTLDNALEFDAILGKVMTAKQLELWKTHATNLKGTVTDAKGTVVTGVEVVITGKTSFNITVTSDVKPGNYNVTIKFEDDRTGEEGLFIITGKLIVDAFTITPNLADGYWVNNVLTIPGVFTDATTPFDLSVKMNDAFIITAPEGMTVTKEYALVREDITDEYIEINGDKITWKKNLAKENLIGKELEFIVTVKNGSVVLAKETYKLKFVNPLSAKVEQNEVKHTLANDRNSTAKSTFDLNKLLSFKDVQTVTNELFGLSGDGSKEKPYASTGDFTSLAYDVYGLEKSNVKFEVIGENNTNLVLDEETGEVTWTNVTGAEFNGVTVNFKVTIIHNYGTSTGNISVTIKEKEVK